MTPNPGRRRVLTAAAGAIAAGVAGCLGTGDEGSDSIEDDGATGEPGDPTGHVTVGVHASPRFKFDPALVHLRPGGTVTWEVVDDYRHAIASYHPDTHRGQRIPDDAEPWTSGQLRGGMTFEHTFEQEGIYDYADTRSLCSSHEAIGGVGRVIVGEPELDSEPAYQDSVRQLPSRAETVFRDLNERTAELLGEP